MPDREDLLDRNPKTGVAHPKPEWKAQRWNGFSWFYELQYSLLTAFTCLIFVATFLIDSKNHPITGSGPSRPIVPSEPVTLCGQYQDATTLSGQYTIGTNQWGQDGSGAQCLLYNPNRVQASDATSFTATWSWTENIDNVHSYPNVAPVSEDFPILVKDMQALNVDADWTMGPGNVAVATTVEADLVASYVKANVAFDLFLDTDGTAAGDPTSAAYEFMVWLAAYGGTQPIGWTTTPTKKTYSLGGQTFTLYSGQNSNGQTVHSWYPTTATPSFTGNLMELLNYLVLAGSVPSNAYIGSVQFGTETTHSIGNVTFDASNVMMDLNVNKS